MSSKFDQSKPPVAPSPYDWIMVESFDKATKQSSTTGFSAYDLLTPAENIGILQRANQANEQTSQFLPATQLVASETAHSDDVPAKEENAPSNMIGGGDWQPYSNQKDNTGAPGLENKGDGVIVMSADTNTTGGITHPIDHKFKNKDGQAIHVEYYSKSPENLGMSVQVLQGQEPNRGSLNEHVPLSANQPESEQKEGWQRHECDVIVPKSAKGELQLHFKPDKGAGQIEIKGIKVTSNDALQNQLSKEVDPKTVQENIAKNHTGAIEYRVIGPDGQPVANAPVKVEQESRPTEFGVEVEHLNPGDQSPEQQNYQKNLDKGFNAVTISVYGDMMEKDGQMKPDAVRAIQQEIDWAQKHGKTVRMHPLVWDNCLPDSISGADRQKAWEQEQAMAQQLMKTFPTVHEFIGFNEAFNNKDNPISQHIAENRVGAVEDTMQREQAAEPKSTFIYNDYKNNDEEIALLQQMQKIGKLPDAIGVQLHMHRGEMPLEQVQHFMDKLSQFHRPIYITEMTVVSGEPRNVPDDQTPPNDWKSTPEGEREQAKYLDRLYKLLYSNPDVKGISYWDLSDTQKSDEFHNGAWKHAPGGVLEANGKAKPAYKDLNHLINHEWKTKQTLTTDDNGTTDSSGQLGSYSVTVPGHRVTSVDETPGEDGDGTFTIDQTTGKKIVTIRVE